MLRLEGFMEIQKLHHDGLSVSEIARRLNLDRKTVRKYLRQAPREYERKPKSWKVDPFRAYLRERCPSLPKNDFVAITPARTARRMHRQTLKLSSDNSRPR